MPERGGPEAERRRAAARTLLLDHAAAEAVEALRAAGVRAIVLKGPALARWLYDDGAFRSYDDGDLLVAPSDLPGAAAVLSRLGYLSLPSIPGDRPSNSSKWWRDRDGTVIDLHNSLWGVGVEPERLWEILSAHTERLVLAGNTVDVLDLRSRAVHLALHAAQHGGHSHPLEDLRRGLDRISWQTWREAAGLARLLDAAAPFAAGLRLLPEGKALADELDLSPVSTTLDLEIRRRGRPPTTLGWRWLVQQKGFGLKARLLWRKLVPPAPLIQAWWPPAERGSAWLALGYARRMFWLLRRAPRALWTLHVAERAVASANQESAPRREADKP